MKMTTIITYPSQQTAPKMSAYERLRKASRDLAQAVSEQHQAVKSLQGNLHALDGVLDRMESSFQNVHDSLDMPLGKLAKGEA
tara:strand:- start:432 stop:680 length:249 start_codon:yes stop_codon:yes gene_type:complete